MILPDGPVVISEIHIPLGSFQRQLYLIDIAKVLWRFCDIVVVPVLESLQHGPHFGINPSLGNTGGSSQVHHIRQCLLSLCPFRLINHLLSIEERSGLVALEKYDTLLRGRRKIRRRLKGRLEVIHGLSVGLIREGAGPSCKKSLCRLDLLLTPLHRLCSHPGNPVGRIFSLPVGLYELDQKCRKAQYRDQQGTDRVV